MAGTGCDWMAAAESLVQLTKLRQWQGRFGLAQACVVSAGERHSIARCGRMDEEENGVGRIDVLFCGSARKLTALEERNGNFCTAGVSGNARQYVLTSKNGWAQDREAESEVCKGAGPCP